MGVRTLRREGVTLGNVQWTWQHLLAELLLAGALALSLLMRPLPERARLAADPPEGATFAPSAAAVVTVYVQASVAPSVVAIGDAVSRVDHLVTVYHDAQEGNNALAPLFSQQATLLGGLGAELAIMPLPRLEPALTLQLRSLLEDLALASEQLASLWTDTATAATTRPFAEAINSVGYWPRVLSALANVRRASGWLTTLDHETGAHVTLPGFAGGHAPDDPSGF